MKNKISKIMGIVLTLAILAGLLMSAMPVTAASLSWENTKVPNNNDFQLVAGNTANVYAFAADGKTVFNYDNVGFKLYKSVDGGIIWATINIGTGLPAAAISTLAVSPNYATDTTVWAAVGAALWRSRNGGQTWAVDATYGGVGAIASVQAAKWYVSGGNIALLVVTPTQIWVYNDNDNWINYAAVGAFPVGCNPIAATFSPNFQSDALIIAVTEDAAGAYVDTRVGNANWNATMKRAVFQTKSALAITLGVVANARFAFPSDFNYNTSSFAKIYVGLSGLVAPLGGSYDVFRINGQLQTVPASTFIATNLDLTGTDGLANFNVADVAYTGTAASGTMVVSLLGSNAIYRTANVSSSTPTWDAAMNAPYGNSPSMAFVGTTLYAGTLKSFSKSADYNSFAGISLISVSGLGASVLNFSQNKILGTDWYILLTDVGAGAPEMVFKSADNGITWGMVYQAIGIAALSPSPAYATDKTIYAYTKNPAPPDVIYKSGDAGATWSMFNPTSKNQSVSALTAIDANSYWFGSTIAAGGTGGIYKSGSYTETSLLDGTVPFAIATPPVGIIVITTSGEIYLSTDQGATFTRLGSAAQFGAASAGMAVDVPTKTIYACSTTNAASTIFKWTIGTSTSWETVILISTAAPACVDYRVKSLSFTGGVLYVVAVNGLSGGWTIPPPAPPVPAAANPAYFQILRCVNLTQDPGRQTFEVMAGSQYDPSGFGGFQGAVHPQPITVVNDKFNGNTIYPCVMQTAGVATPNKTAAHIYSFADVLSMAPGTSAPTPNAQVPTITNAAGAQMGAFTFAWKPVTASVPITYRAEIATDAKFDSAFAILAAGSATTAYNAGMIPGQAYFFRVRTDGPYASPWSVSVPFNVQLAGDANMGLNASGRMSPANGETGTSLTPTFTWGAVAGSQSYTLQLADNPFFANPIEKKPLTTTIWVWDSALKPNTVYYWRVQAVAGGNASTWVANAFTTGTGVAAGPAATAAPAPAPTIIVPTPVVNVSVPAPTSQAAAPETPPYIWIIIAIGAVLVIAVIVLIVRTRRAG